MRPLSYARAADADTAIAMVEARPDSAFLAGGTTEVDLVRQDVLRPGLLIDINDLPLTGVEDLPGGGLLIGRTKAAPHADRWAAWKSDTRSTAGTLPGKSEVMPEVIAGLEIPETAAAAEATRLIQETTSPLIYHHSRRVFFFGLIHAHKLGVKPDPELLYLAAMFHDTGLLTPFSDVEQRFEVDSADHARKFLLDRGFSTAAAETVWTAIALHTTPGIPAQMAPEIATTHLGVLTDAVGFGLDGLEHAQLGEILAVHPRGDFKNEFLRAYVDGLKDRPETTNGTVNSDVLEHFIPGFQRTTTVERIVGSPWPS